MKKIYTLISISTILVLASCSNSTETTTTEPTTTPTTETTTTESTTTTHNATSGTKENPDHTTIGVDQNGVNYSKKSGTNETDVKISTDSNKFQIIKKK